MARAATTARTAKTDSDDPAKDLDAEIAALREDVAAITATLGDVVKYRTGEAKTEARRLRKSAERKGEETLEQVQDSFEAAEGELKTMIREKPISSVLIAAGIGYVLSKIL
ncbi:hypothetical protein OF122_07425 [Pelagibacterium flavum]|uniref:DUF883 domain-containing protein n=1 Tax=Pelagibacterium flavum TaxID=2984530 RepID=A0ABY6ISG2_9HYPH|nr:hypothetical protein [Pelagibacterium sp. YIM 151497]UYQ73576.1 hypothetical protein OF122_07425 [Pelagibacterium sp. YIM 151497]|tara:strand:- start:1896 stop:2228 length:333 start_codon:yes stop_codon:yes gene_type:complete|eukprot:jgi/Tetstr1/451209/TSEL_038245.t1